MSFTNTFLRLLGLTGTAYAACSNLLIDDFSRSTPSGLNNLSSWTSDDGSMSSIALSSGVLSFTPNSDSSSYFYETLGCYQAASRGYKALSLTVKGPKDASFVVEIQSKQACTDQKYKSQWVVVSGLTGSTQTVSIALSSFTGASLDGIVGFVWSSYTRISDYQFSNIQLTCNENTDSSSSVASPSATSTRPLSTSSTSRARSASSSSTSTISQGRTSTGSSTSTSSPVSSSCSSLLIDDWESQSRLTFLFYNAMLQPSSDDGTMNKIEVANNRVTLTPNNKNSYFYSKTACTNVQAKGYGGISLRIKASRGATFGVQLASATTCSGEDTAFGFQTTSELGWTFDGTEKLYSLPFSKFTTIDLSKVSSVLFTALSGPVQFGPMSFYCGAIPSEYVVNPLPSATAPVSTVAAPSSTAAAKLIDDFSAKDQNSLGQWHGGDNENAVNWVKGKVTIKAPDADFAYYTQFEKSCADLTSYDGSYLHVAYTGSNKFTIAMQQHNSQCNDAIAPFPETWDSLEAARYATGNHIYIPMSHFNIVRTRVVGLAFKGFYTNEAVTLTKIEIVSSVPKDVYIPTKMPSGNLVFACKRPNSIAFAIDDGDPTYAQEVMEVIRSENIKVTFFTVGAPLRDPSTNLSNIYQDMMTQGHQMALHSYTHPRMEGLPNNDAIAWEYKQDIDAVSDMFNGLKTKYFRPPFGNEGARMRQQLVSTTGRSDAYIVNWNIDVEDWLWATSSTPEKQLEAFQRDLDKGGSLVVMHYLYPSTVKYLRQFIQMAKKTNKQLMRVDQCMEDPEAPPL
ncbi:glycoside hydrolase/deacetylase [Colletotrichum eremochloae]|nr:glycoside hydrolase/deacetylase [Colletotrichum eremochloae]